VTALELNPFLVQVKVIRPDVFVGTCGGVSGRGDFRIPQTENLMAQFFSPTQAERQALEQLIGQVAEVQRTLVANHPQLQKPDRGAHQQQLAGGKVSLHVASQLPQEISGLGIFQPGAQHIGIGRMSTGLGCPHAETDPDFLGLMVAFQSHDGRRMDFVTINHPAAPTDTPAEFIALLKATADAAGGEHASDLANLLSSQTRLLVGLARHAGTRAPAIATQVIRQTARTTRSASAYQPYWTGVVRARDVLGKFTFVPTEDVNEGEETTRRSRFSSDWRIRQARGPLQFRLYWIPFLNERDTPLKDLTKEWTEHHKVLVGTVTFPSTDPESTETKLLALLASEMGANPGNWIEDDRGDAPDLPATEYTAARFLAYRASQRLRDALPDDRYASFFKTGTIDATLATELLHRYEQKRAMGHNVPEVGEVAAS